MKDLLFLSHRIPYPPTRGDKIRSWHILRHLAKRYRVHLGCFYDDPSDEEHVGTLREVIKGDCLCLPLHKSLALARGATRLLRGLSLTEGYFSNKRLRYWVQSVSSSYDLECTFVYCSAMAPYA